MVKREVIELIKKHIDAIRKDGILPQFYQSLNSTEF